MDSKAPPAFRDVCTISQPPDPLFPPYSYFIRYFLFTHSHTIGLPFHRHHHLARTTSRAFSLSPPLGSFFFVFPPSFPIFGSLSLSRRLPSRPPLDTHSLASISSILLLRSFGMRVNPYHTNDILIVLLIVYP